MSQPSDSSIYINPHASEYITHPSPESTSATRIKSFHHSLPNFNTTPLHNLPSLALALGVSHLLIKSESSRLKLPAFKILGASWGTYRALCSTLNILPDPEALPWQAIKQRLEKESESGKEYVLFAATDGNHGRAVARMAAILLPETQVVKCRIYVPEGMYETTKSLISSEGADVVTVDGDYDFAVAQCWRECTKLEHESNGSRIGVMVQDNAFEGYDTVPNWIVEGYGTMLAEVDEQFDALMSSMKKPNGNGGGEGPEITHIVTPIGVGSLGHAVVNWAKDEKRKRKVRVIAVEPETAACLNVSLWKGKSTIIGTEDTIMSGMCCGTVSPTSWKSLRDGVDCSSTMGDWECHQTVLELRDEQGIEAGPCGAGCLTGLRKVLRHEKARKALDLSEQSVVVVLSTEGKREYPTPQKP